MNIYIRFLPFICIGLLLVACGDGGTSEPIQYPKQSAIEILSSAESSSETASSMTESSLSEENSSSETLSNSSSSYAKSSSGELKSSSVVKSSSSIVAPPCKTETEDNCEYGTLVDDRDGQTYKTVRIGEQWWMAENLNYAYLQPTSTLDSSSWCYDNDPENCKKYGRLYLWSAAIDSAALFSINGKGFGYGDDCGTLAQPKKCSPDIPLRGACPSGWHLTSTEEWLDLLFAVDGDLANLLKSRNDWPNGLGGEDAFGFGVLPSGMASSRRNTVSYWQLGEVTDFWTSGGESTTAWTSGVLSEDDFSWKWDALPVRCIKDVLENE